MNRRRVLPSRSIVMLLAIASALVSLAAPASAVTSAIQLGRIQYDSPGSDMRTNASLNGEYFVVGNTGTVVRSLKGFTVRDAQNHVYTFAAFNLGAHKAVR